MVGYEIGFDTRQPLHENDCLSLTAEVMRGKQLTGVTADLEIQGRRFNSLFFLFYYFDCHLIKVMVRDKTTKIRPKNAPNVEINNGK